MLGRDYLTLVNAGHPLPPGRPLRLAPVNRQDKGVLLEAQAARQLNRLLAQLSGSPEAGWRQICAVSGWRSLREQQSIWDGSLAENGREFTAKYVALPGCSEHQTGLAIDLGLRLPQIDFIRPEFPYDGLAGAFRRLAADFGFVERYPKGKEAICGIAHEPWHFRYVGPLHARQMQRLGMVLEEYLPWLEARR